MFKKYFLVLLFSVFLPIIICQSDPIITSWIKSTGYNGYNNILTNVNKIQYSTNYVYVSSSSVPSYSVGPWLANPNLPGNQNYTFKFARYPAQNTGVKTKVPLGHIGIWSNGVSVYNADDGQTWANAGVWSRNAYFWEGISFDSCLGHAAANKEYHNHVAPKCMFNSTDSTKHSPIIGFAFDGFPIYGPFAYSNPLNSGSSIKRVQTGYKTRNITARSSLSNGTILTTAQYGPSINSSYPLGAFIDDFEYVAGYGDLDLYNGRFGITPEYPNGTYAYFVTTDSSGTPVYPFVVGPYFYGTLMTANIGPTSGKITPTETVATYYDYNSTLTNSSASTSNSVTVSSNGVTSASTSNSATVSGSGGTPAGTSNSVTVSQQTTLPGLTLQTTQKNNAFNMLRNPNIQFNFLIFVSFFLQNLIE